jgi:hypothetical protein
MGPHPLAELVERARVEEPRCDPRGETIADLRTRTLCFGEKTLTRSETTQGVPEGPIAPTLIDVRRLMGFDPGEQGVGEGRVEPLDRPHHRETERDPESVLIQWAKNRQDHHGERGAAEDERDSTYG